MDRRKSLKLIAAGAVAAPMAIAACKADNNKDGQENKVADNKFNLDRNPDELKHENKLLSEEKFFTPHEMATITILADIIIPKDDVSGSASEAKVPEFIEFIVHDMPNHQVPLKGGLRWLDMHCLKTYNLSFKDCSNTQQMEVVNAIAFPKKAKPEMGQGVKFFSLMRDLTATGFYTSEMGVKDLGYVGNTPTQWNGVPNDVLKQYKLAYTDKELKECVSFNKAG
ncbi:MAG TPA: gluconate 2-dehydrogenase subunit 3 family protein [Chitinophagaceae bacterium]|jgi:gluconate 2-dehydrogenase gamma chain|nr:gluconate 2-dehydrogenase subunit 3 family protein [Chitinophagaceae bacterium]HNA19664.1 gluconate 2-dehydrogenase subunit 3 family protein [Chitinophagaceae bacterium]HNA97511.1 gluconate 2-dehydrogenase subunit 3 family protein [Chitinophagaceae bacterium]HNO53521.1 gluconate 2-dehydrogenase subunit 3 family protein [Chitinophagaceae bacterium]HRF24290.1 gluconate 2-dehydrogenase subunit 3 family protein [Chitinophagaceae bacterium]